MIFHCGILERDKPTNTSTAAVRCIAYNLGRLPGFPNSRVFFEPCGSGDEEVLAIMLENKLVYLQVGAGGLKQKTWHLDFLYLFVGMEVDSLIRLHERLKLSPHDRCHPLFTQLEAMLNDYGSEVLNGSPSLAAPWAAWKGGL